MGSYEYCIIDFMDKNNMSQADLARVSGVSKSSISRYLQGEDIPVSKLKKIAAALGTTVDELLGIDFSLSADEQELVDCYRAATEAEQSALLQVARTYAEGK